MREFVRRYECVSLFPLTSGQLLLILRPLYVWARFSGELSAQLKRRPLQDVHVFRRKILDERRLVLIEGQRKTMVPGRGSSRWLRCILCHRNITMSGKKEVLCTKLSKGEIDILSSDVVHKQMNNIWLVTKIIKKNVW